MKLIVLILTIIISCYLIYKMYIDYKNSESSDERVLLIILIIVFFIPITVYICDRYDLFAKFGWLNHVSREKWFDFFITYFSGLMTSLIAAVVLIRMTTFEMIQSRKKELFDKRVQNAPIFKYTIQNEKIDNFEHIMILNDLKEDNTLQYYLFMQFENIGLNIARHVKIQVFVDNKKYGDYSVNDIQSIIKVNELKVFCFSFGFSYKEKQNNKRKIKFIIYYEDILKNRYNQTIDVNVLPTSIMGSKSFGHKLEICDIKINDEEWIKE